MSPGLKNGRIIQPEQADVGCFQSQYDPETTRNTVRHNLRTFAGDIHTETHKRLKQFGCRVLLGNCTATLTEEDWRRLEVQGAFFSMN